jgi:DNA polymerase
MFIGEGPGFNEDKKGLPFVGRSGDYLEKMLAEVKPQAVAAFTS